MRRHGLIVPSSAVDRLVLADGVSLTVRPVERTDRDRLRVLFAGLSPESRYRRFLSPKPKLTESELQYLVEVDHVRHEALAAVDDRDGSFVGVARYIQRADRPPAADMAITVADRHQNMGLGAALGARILERAQTNGFDALTASTLRENPPARAVLRRLGFAPRSSNGREIEFERELTVEPTGAVTMRVATPDDLPALRRLAALDSTRVPALPVLIAEVDGEPRAALSLNDGATVADPFHPTDALVRLLATRATQLLDRGSRRKLDIWSGVLDPVPALS